MHYRCPVIVLLVCVVSTSCSWPSDVNGEETPKEIVKNWKEFPVPHGTPKTPQPRNSEFMKVLPRPRPMPRWGRKDVEVGLRIWWSDHGQFIYGKYPPTREDLEREGLARTPAGEDEPLVMGIWGIRDVGKVSLSVKDSPFPVTIRTAVFDNRQIPHPYYDYKVKGAKVVGLATYLPKSAETTVEKDSNAVYWINVEVPKEASAGRYELSLELLVQSQNKKIEIPAVVDVLGFALPRAKIAFAMFFRPPQGREFVDERYCKPELLKMYWRDLARHGMTSASVYNYIPLHDGKGNLKLDGHIAVEHIESMIAEGLVTPDVPIIYLDGGGFNRRTPGHIELMGKFVAEAKRRGWPEILYYSQDEPGLDEHSRAEILSFVPVREHMRTITAITGQAALAYKDYLDVWAVAAGQTSPELQQVAKECGAEVWNYNCHSRGRANIPFNRFYAGLYTWGLGLKGNLLWSYFVRDYSWEGNRNAVYCWVLPSDEGPVPSVAWEARREGVEDYRYLTLLESLIGVNPERAEAAEAKAWLEELRGRVDWYVAREMPPSLYPWDGSELYPICPNFEPAEFTQIRNRMIDYIQKLLPAECGLSQCSGPEPG